MGVENAETIQIIANSIGVFIAVLAGICFWIGVMNPDRVTPLTFKAPTVNDDDLFAVASGDEDYLMAHCVVKEQEKDEVKPMQYEIKKEKYEVKPIQDEIKKEKDDLQRLRNKITRIKLEKQLRDLEGKEQTVNPLLSDCVDAMVSMGETKTKAKVTVNKYFDSNPNTSTLEEFLSGVFK
jgi:hypothetical protein